MSLNIDPLKTVNVVDPRINVNEKSMFAINRTAEEITYRTFNSSNVSNSSIQFTCPPPSENIAVSRHVYLKIPFRITVTKVDDGNPCFRDVLNGSLVGSDNALRQAPLSSIIQTATVTINNTSFSINMNDVIHPLLAYNTCYDLTNLNFSGTPMAPDFFQSYNDYVSLGNAKNALGQIGVSYEDMRGGFRPLTVITNTNTQGVLEGSVIEPLFVPPLAMGKKHDKGFLGVRTFDIQLTLGDLSRLFSHATPTTTFTNLTGDILNTGGNSPQAHFLYLTPPVNMPLPDKLTYPYYTVDRYPTELGTINANTNFTTTSNNIQLNSIPNRMYIFARRSNQDRTYLTTDTYARINSVSVNFQNRSGLLSSASAEDLWQMSVKNGLKMSWSEYYAYRGSVLCISLADLADIGLSPLQASGKTEQMNFNIRVDGRNIAGENINMTLYIVVISEGTMSICNGSTIAQIGVISEKDILEAPEAPEMDYNNDMIDVQGGDLVSGIKKVYSKGKNLGKKALPYVKEGIKGVKKGVDIVKALEPYLSGGMDIVELLAGAGYSETEINKMLTKKMKGGKLVGSNQLRKKLLEY